MCGDHSIMSLCQLTTYDDPDEWMRTFKQVGLSSDDWDLAVVESGTWALIDVHTTLLPPIS